MASQQLAPKQPKQKDLDRTNLFSEYAEEKHRVYKPDLIYATNNAQMRTIKDEKSIKLMTKNALEPSLWSKITFKNLASFETSLIQKYLLLVPFDECLTGYYDLYEMKDINAKNNSKQQSKKDETEINEYKNANEQNFDLSSDDKIPQQQPEYKQFPRVTLEFLYYLLKSKQNFQKYFQLKKLNQDGTSKMDKDFIKKKLIEQFIPSTKGNNYNDLKLKKTEGQLTLWLQSILNRLNKDKALLRYINSKDLYEYLYDMAIRKGGDNEGSWKFQNLQKILGHFSIKPIKYMEVIETHYLFKYQIDMDFWEINASNPDNVMLGIVDSVLDNLERFEPLCVEQKYENLSRGLIVSEDTIDQKEIQFSFINKQKSKITDPYSVPNRKKLKQKSQIPDSELLEDETKLKYNRHLERISRQYRFFNQQVLDKKIEDSTQLIREYESFQRFSGNRMKFQKFPKTPKSIEGFYSMHEALSMRQYCPYLQKDQQLNLTLNQFLFQTEMEFLNRKDDHQWSMKNSIHITPQEREKQQKEFIKYCQKIQQERQLKRDEFIRNLTIFAAQFIAFTSPYINFHSKYRFPLNPHNILLRWDDKIQNRFKLNSLVYAEFLIGLGRQPAIFWEDFHFNYLTSDIYEQIKFGLEQIYADAQKFQYLHFLPFAQICLMIYQYDHILSMQNFPQNNQNPKRFLQIVKNLLKECAQLIHLKVNYHIVVDKNDGDDKYAKEMFQEKIQMLQKKISILQKVDKKQQKIQNNNIVDKVSDQIVDLIRLDLMYEKINSQSDVQDSQNKQAEEQRSSKILVLSMQNSIRKFEKIFQRSLIKLNILKKASFQTDLIIQYYHLNIIRVKNTANIIFEKSKIIKKYLSEMQQVMIIVLQIVRNQYDNLAYTIHLEKPKEDRGGPLSAVFSIRFLKIVLFSQIRRLQIEVIQKYIKENKKKENDKNKNPDQELNKDKNKDKDEKTDSELNETQDKLYQPRKMMYKDKKIDQGFKKYLIRQRLKNITIQCYQMNQCVFRQQLREYQREFQKYFKKNLKQFEKDHYMLSIVDFEQLKILNEILYDINKTMFQQQLMSDSYLEMQTKFKQFEKVSVEQNAQYYDLMQIKNWISQKIIIKDDLRQNQYRSLKLLLCILDKLLSSSDMISKNQFGFDNLSNGQLSNVSNLFKKISPIITQIKDGNIYKSDKKQLSNKVLDMMFAYHQTEGLAYASQL